MHQCKHITSTCAACHCRVLNEGKTHLGTLAESLDADDRRTCILRLSGELQPIQRHHRRFGGQEGQSSVGRGLGIFQLSCCLLQGIHLLRNEPGKQRKRVIVVSRMEDLPRLMTMRCGSSRHSSRDKPGAKACRRPSS